MKNSISILLLLFAFNFNYAQQWLGANNTTSSIFRLPEVGIGFSTTPSFGTNKFLVNGNSYFSGNVGIGASTPNGKLDVKGDVRANQTIITTNQLNGTVFPSIGERNDKCLALAVGSSIGSGSGYLNTRMLNFFDFPSTTSGTNIGSTAWFSIDDRNDFTRFKMTASTGGNTYFGVLNKSQQDIFAVNEDGNDNVILTLPKTNSFLGIGTTSFNDGVDTFRLSVKGNIRAERVKVYTTWADFVFKKNYQLQTLEEVEQYIKLEGHLKDIPSAKEVELNGIELGEMNKKLLQKVEELTLYLIEIKKEINNLKLKK